MKWLGKPSAFHLFTNPSVINRFIFGQGVIIYYLYILFEIVITFGVCKAFLHEFISLSKVGVLILFQLRNVKTCLSPISTKS